MVLRIALILAVIVLVGIAITMIRSYRQRLRDQESQMEQDMWTEIKSNYTEEQIKQSVGETEKIEPSFGENVLDEPIRKPIPTETIEATANKNIVIINVIAHDGEPFDGHHLLKSILVQGLRFTPLKIFQLHELPEGRGRVVFNLTQVVEPGVFNLANFHQLSCPGISLFFEATKSEEPLQDFEIMLQKARLLADDLKGQIMNEQHELLNDSDIEQLRNDMIGIIQAQQEYENS